MRTYTGTKTVKAAPMNRADYNTLRGWVLPADENGADEGYLVEYIDGGQPNTTQYVGYVSWSPKDVFEKAYKEVKPLSKTNDIPIAITEIDLPETCKIAPRVTMKDIVDNIVSEHYFTGEEGCSAGYHPDGVNTPRPKSLANLTICILVLKNGFTVIGESACASPENFDAEWGRKIAKDTAIEKIWPLMGYALRDRLAAPVETD